jgi:hypothetical protein
MNNITHSLMLCYARSGGTLLNQILGMLPDTIVLSEVSPYGGGWGVLKDKSATTIAEQLKSWYEIEIDKGEFKYELSQTVEYCKINNKNLVVRDWSFASFTPIKKNNFKPPMKLSSLEIYTQQTKELKTFALVRHPLDVWISRGERETDEFLSAYGAFINEITALGIKTFKYENLCSDPHSTVKTLCDFLNIKYSDDVLKFSKFKRVNGDVQSKVGVERHFSETEKIERRIKTPQSLTRMVKLLFNRQYREMCKKLDYPYYDNRVSFKRLLKSLSTAKP